MFTITEVGLALTFVAIMIAMAIAIERWLGGSEFGHRDDFFFDATLFAPLVVIVALFGPLFVQPANVLCLIELAVLSLLHAGDVGESHMSAGILLLWTLLLLPPVACIVAWRVWRRYKRSIEAEGCTAMTRGILDKGCGSNSENPYATPGGSS
jgi:hypothetical protein